MIQLFYRFVGFVVFALFELLYSRGIFAYFDPANPSKDAWVASAQQTCKYIGGYCITPVGQFTVDCLNWCFPKAEPTSSKKNTKDSAGSERGDFELVGDGESKSPFHREPAKFL